MRTLDERLAVRFPRLLHAAARLGARLSPRSHLRAYFVVRRTCQGYQAVNRGDLDVLLTIYQPHVVTSFDPETGLVPPDLAGDHHGHDGFRRIWGSWMDAWEELRLEPQEVVDAGDRMLVHVRARGRGKGSGVETDLTYYEVYTLEDGRIARHENFLDRDQARRAARLAPGDWS